MAEPTHEQCKHTLSLIESLFPFAHVLSKAQNRARDPDVQIDDLAALIKQDAGLSSDIIRISNSAFYSFSTPCSDLDQAINRLGMNELLNLISLNLTEQVFKGGLDHYQQSAAESWSESVSCALLCQQLCKSSKDSIQGGYTVGLLSTIGKMVLNQTANLLGMDACWDTTTTVREWEQKTFGFDHAWAGAMVLKRWEFPADIIAPILYQFEPTRDHDNQRLVTHLHLSRLLCEHCGGSLQQVDIQLNADIEAGLTACELDEEQLRACLEEAREKFLQLRSEMGIH